MTAKKRRGFTIRDSDCKNPGACLEEHQQSKAQIGDRKSGLVKDRIIAQIGAGKYGELLQRLNGITVDEK